MPLGTFVLVIGGEQQDGTAETKARLHLLPQGVDTLIDADADEFKFPSKFAKATGEGISLSPTYELTLFTDSDSGPSTTIGYEGYVATGNGGRVDFQIAAQEAGTTKALTDLTDEPIVSISSTQQYRDEAEAAATAAAASAASVNREQASGVAGLTAAGKLYEARIPDRLTDASLSATYGGPGALDFGAGGSASPFGAPEVLTDRIAVGMSTTEPIFIASDGVTGWAIGRESSLSSRPLLPPNADLQVDWLRRTCVIRHGSFFYGVFRDKTTGIASVWQTGVTPSAWTKIHDLSAGATTQGQVISEWLGTYMFVGEYGDPVGGPSVWRTSDASTFTRIYGPDPAVRHIHAVAVDPLNTSHVYITTGDGNTQATLKRSTDNGATWTTIYSGDSLLQSVQISFTATHIWLANDGDFTAPIIVDRATLTPQVAARNYHGFLPVPGGKVKDAWYSQAYYGAWDATTGRYYFIAHQDGSYGNRAALFVLDRIGGRSELLAVMPSTYVPGRLHFSNTASFTDRWYVTSGNTRKRIDKITQQASDGSARISDLADVAVSGSYDDLLDKPVLATQPDLDNQRGDLNWTKPNGVVRQNMPRFTQFSTTLAAPTSGTLYLSGIYLWAGDVISGVSFFTGTTALAGGSNQWFALYDAARNKLAVSADDTSAAWGASAKKTLTLTAPYTVPTSGLYYVAFCIVATTMPTLTGINVNNSAISAQAPLLYGASDPGLTNPASAPAVAAALTHLPRNTYAQVV